MRINSTLSRATRHFGRFNNLSRSLTKTQTLSSLICLILYICVCGPTNSLADITNVVLPSVESNSHTADDGMGGSSSECLIEMPTVLPNFTHTFSALGDEIWTVTWRAPEGMVFEIAAPGEFDTVQLFLEYAWGGSTNGVPDTVLTPTATVAGESGDPLPAATTTEFRLPDLPTTNMVIASAGFNLTPGNTYRFQEISLSTTIPAAYNEDVDLAASAPGRLAGFRAYTSKTGTSTDPGQWFQIIDPNLDPNLQMNAKGGLKSSLSNHRDRFKGSTTRRRILEHFSATNEGGDGTASARMVLPRATKFRGNVLRLVGGSWINVTGAMKAGQTNTYGAGETDRYKVKVRKKVRGRARAVTKLISGGDVCKGVVLFR